MRKFVTIIFFACFAVVLRAQLLVTDDERHATREAVRARLATAKTAADSVSLLYDVFDLTDNSKKRGEVALELIEVAKSAGDSMAIYDMLRQASQSFSLDDKRYKWLEAEASRMPAGDNRRETETFMRLSRLSRQLRKYDADERRVAFRKRLDQFSKDKVVDRWRRIEVLFTLCLYLSNTSNSPVLEEYMNDLGALIDALPPEAISLRNLYAVTAANVYTSVGNLKGAVKADSELIKLMDNLRDQYHANGRKYRNYASTRYIVYRRMLGNAKGLKPEQIDSLYIAINKLIASHTELASTEESVRLTEPYYAMAKGNYAAAVPLLQEALAQKSNKSRRFQLTGMLVEAAKATGNRDVLVPAIEDYMEMLKKRVVNSEKDRIIEYQVLHDIENLQVTNTALEIRNNQLVSNMIRTSRIATYIIFAALLVILAIVAFAYMRTKRISKSLAESNAQLTDERDKLRRTQQDLIVARDNADTANRKKTEFLHNVSHEISGPTQAIVGYSQLIVDSADDKTRQYLQRFTNIIDINARLLQAQVNDLLDAAELENYNVTLKQRNTLFSQLVDMAVDAVSNKLKADVKLKVEPFDPHTDPGLEIVTDAARAEQVMLKLLSNAVKFTELGSITVRYGRRGDLVMFEVEDTGPGVPHEKVEAIFGRFEKVSNYAGGMGLGLHIARMVAKLLGGNVYLDTTYTDGARFVFELPYEKNKQQ